LKAPVLPKIRFSGVKAFLKSMWRIGLFDKGRFHYWMLILWSLKKPSRLPLAVRYSIYGFHFRKILKSIPPQIKVLRTNTSIVEAD
jgi:hypothetical protein